jgi:hypothetical protein
MLRVTATAVLVAATFTEPKFALVCRLGEAAKKLCVIVGAAA